MEKAWQFHESSDTSHGCPHVRILLASDPEPTLSCIACSKRWTLLPSGLTHVTYLDELRVTIAAGVRWIDLRRQRPEEGQWVLMYLTRYAGMDRFRAGIHIGPDEWLSAACAYEGVGQMPDSFVSHWMPMPAGPEQVAEPIQHSELSPGTPVQWTYRRGAAPQRGTVVLVVPAGVSPETAGVGKRLRLPQRSWRTRDHESYLVEGGGPLLYWPPASRLRRRT